MAVCEVDSVPFVRQFEQGGLMDVLDQDQSYLGWLKSSKETMEQDEARTS